MNDKQSLNAIFAALIYAVILLALLGLLFLLFIPYCAEAHPKPVNLELLRDVICAYETRGVEKPDEAVGLHGELGRCQIKPNTAKWVGYGKWWRLRDSDYSKRAALAILKKCWSRYKRRTVRSLASCYHGGPGAKRAHVIRYIEAVDGLYKQALDGPIKLAKR